MLIGGARLGTKPNQKGNQTNKKWSTLLNGREQAAQLRGSLGNLYPAREWGWRLIKGEHSQ